MPIFAQSVIPAPCVESHSRFSLTHGETQQFRMDRGVRQCLLCGEVDGSKDFVKFCKTFLSEGGKKFICKIFSLY